MFGLHSLSGLSAAFYYCLKTAYFAQCGVDTKFTYSGRYLSGVNFDIYCVSTCEKTTQDLVCNWLATDLLVCNM